MDPLPSCLHVSLDTPSVCLLLKDQRVDVNELDENGEKSSLWYAAANGQLDVIKCWIASGREMALGTPGDEMTDVIGAASERGNSKPVVLLKRFKENPEETRHQVRLEIGWFDDAAAENFALIVFVSDDLLQIKATPPTPAAKFFNIARRLPLELQMVLCHRVVGSAKEIIQGKDSEAAFKSLAKRLLWSSFYTSN